MFKPSHPRALKGHLCSQEVVRAWATWLEGVGGKMRLGPLLGVLTVVAIVAGTISSTSLKS
eukprot:1312748-Amphidinium_carterae.1